MKPIVITNLPKFDSILGKLIATPAEKKKDSKSGKSKR